MIRKQISAIAAILAERERQVAVEGWTAAHDDTHNAGELIAAAECYFGDPAIAGLALPAPAGWPFEAAAWKPKDRRRNLERAGAFLMAEADRIVRLEKRAPAEGDKGGKVIIDDVRLKENLRIVVAELDALNARELAVEAGDISFRAPDADPDEAVEPVGKGASKGGKK